MASIQAIPLDRTAAQQRTTSMAATDDTAQVAEAIQETKTPGGDEHQRCLQLRAGKTSGASKLAAAKEDIP